MEKNRNSLACLRNTGSLSRNRTVRRGERTRHEGKQREHGRDRGTHFGLTLGPTTGRGGLLNSKETTQGMADQNLWSEFVVDVVAWENERRHRTTPPEKMAQEATEPRVLLRSVVEDKSGAHSRQISVIGD